MKKLTQIPNTQAPTLDHPYGALRDETALGVGDGTPARSDWLMDPFGAIYALLDEAGIEPNEQTETASDSQVVTAIQALINNAITESTAPIGPNKPFTDLPSTYPNGVTRMAITADVGWPTDNGNVLTVKLSNSQIFQFFVANANVHFAFRITSSDDTWATLRNIFHDDWAVDRLQFNTTPISPFGIGTLRWNETENTLDLGMTAEVTQQIGMEVFYPVVFNDNGETLKDGTLVMVNPAEIIQGDKLNAIKAVADGSVPAKLILGVVTEDIPVSQTGHVTWFGQVRDILLADIKPVAETWVAGDILWANPTTPGIYTNVEPSAPNLKVAVAVVMRIHGANIDILVRPWKTPNLHEINDVNIVTPTNGQVLTYEDGVWKNLDLPDLPANVALKDANNEFTDTNTFTTAQASGAQALDSFRFRDIYIANTEPTSGDGENGDVWMVIP